MALSPQDDARWVWQQVSLSVHKIFEAGDDYEPANKFESHTAKDMLATYKAITELAMKANSTGEDEIDLYIDPNLLAQTAEEIAAGRD